MIDPNAPTVLTKRVDAWPPLRRIEGRLLVSAVLIAGGLWALLALIDDVREQESARLDRLILLAFRVPGDLGTPVGPRWVQESARDFTALGGFTVLTLISLLAVALLVMHRRKLQSFIFGATVLITQLAAEVVKHLIHRPRPDLVPHHDLVYSSSFPSGHATMSPVVYFTLAVIVAAGERDRPTRALLFAGATLLVVAIGVSRVYLGVHWPTDVLAGWALGGAIALAAMTVLHLTRSKVASEGELGAAGNAER